MAHFEIAATHVAQGQLTNLSDHHKLRLYALYCVATRGVDPGPAPGALHFRAAAKHSAWSEAALSHTPQTARDAYVALVEELKSESHDATPSRSAWGKDAPTGFDIADGRNNTLDICHWASVGDLKSVLSHLQSHTPNYRDEDGLTPLMRAADRGHIAVIDALVEAKADLSLQDPDGLTALHYASVCGHADAAGILVLAGAPLDTQDSDGATPYDVAADDPTRDTIAAARNGTWVRLHRRDKRLPLRVVAALFAVIALVLAMYLRS